MVKRKRKSRGIFAIEGEWSSDLRSGLSFRPILDLINKLNGASIVHRDAATREELFYYLTKWCQSRYSTYPILCLGFHGEQDSILIGDRRATNHRISLDELADHLNGRCQKRIIYFGSCETMNIHGTRIQTFLKRTGALAVCGYRYPIDMLRSAAFELLLFDALLKVKTLTISGARAIERAITQNERSLSKQLGLRMVVRRG